jgi:hypothetical protein
VQACAASNPYNSYSFTTYGTSTGTPTATGPLTSNADIYAARLTYGLPTLSFADAPREQAPTSLPGLPTTSTLPDASVLLATLYGGSSAIGTTGVYGSLASSTINQIIVNTEGKALAAFYNTALSYWSRINLYDAAGYFQNAIGTLRFANGDLVTTNVTAAAGALISTGVVGETSAHAVTVNGGFSLDPNAVLQFVLEGTGAGEYDRLTVNGLASLTGLLDLEFGSGLALSGTATRFELLDYSSFTGEFLGLSVNGLGCSLISAETWSCSNHVILREAFTNGAFFIEASIPEPAAMVILSTGLLGLGAVRRRAR